MSKRVKQFIHTTLGDQSTNFSFKNDPMPREKVTMRVCCFYDDCYLYAVTHVFGEYYNFVRYQFWFPSDDG